MRNVGVCLPIASNYFAGADVTVPMLAFSGIMIPMNMVFSVVAALMMSGKEEIARATKALTGERQRNYSPAKAQSPPSSEKFKIGLRKKLGGEWDLCELSVLAGKGFRRITSRKGAKGAKFGERIKSDLLQSQK